MPRSPKPPAESVSVSFTEPEDIQILDQLKEAAKADRRDLGTFILLQLHRIASQAPAKG